MRIHHLALLTAHVARLERFYAGVLGLGVRERRANGSVWLESGDAIVMLERAEPGEPAPPRGGMDLVAFAIAPHELAVLEARLVTNGVHVEARTPFTIYFRDPDGRRVGVSHYPQG